MSISLIALSIYLVGSILCASYILISHLRALSTYFRRVFTAKEINVSEIRTYFGWQFHDDTWDSDEWFEVLLSSTIFAIMFMLISFVAWPCLSFVILHRAIEQARIRIKQDS
jgi:hypothetical protein